MEATISAATSSKPSSWISLMKAILIVSLAVVSTIIYSTLSVSMNIPLPVWESGVFEMEVEPGQQHVFPDQNSTSSSKEVVLPVSTANKSREVKSILEKASNTSRKILLHWVAGDPLQQGVPKHSYYYDIAKAYVSRTQDIQVCKGLAMAPCLQQAVEQDMIYAPAFCHMVSSDPTTRSLKKSAGKTARQLQQALSSFINGSTAANNKAPCISVIFMLNKAYVALDDKVMSFSKPFHSNGLLRSIDTYSVNLIALTWSAQAENWSRKFGFPFVWIPFATNVEAFKLPFLDWNSRPYDVFLRWDTSPSKYKHRFNISQHLSWNKSKVVEDISVFSPEGFLDAGAYLDAIRDCRMHVATIGMPGRLDLLGTRYFEIMSSGSSLLIVERPETVESAYSYRELGIVENETVAMFSSLAELLDTIRHYKKAEEAAKKLIEAAQVVSLKTHSWERRAAQMVDSVRLRTKCERNNADESRRN